MKGSWVHVKTFTRRPHQRVQLSHKLLPYVRLKSNAYLSTLRFQFHYEAQTLDRSNQNAMSIQRNDFQIYLFRRREKKIIDSIVTIPHSPLVIPLGSYWSTQRSCRLCRHYHRGGNWWDQEIWRFYNHRLGTGCSSCTAKAKSKKTRKGWLLWETW